MKRNKKTKVSVVSKTDLQEKAIIWELFFFVANVPSLCHLFTFS